MRFIFDIAAVGGISISSLSLNPNALGWLHDLLSIRSDQVQFYQLIRSFLIVSIQVLLGLPLPLKTPLTSKQLMFLTIASMGFLYT